MAKSGYRQLLVWQKGMEITRAIYHLTLAFPKHETFGLSSQLQRAAVSIPANLAEGHTRETTKDYLRHVVIAHGSLAELETLLLVARDLQYAEGNAIDRLRELCDAKGKMLASLRRRLRMKIAAQRGNT